MQKLNQFCGIDAGDIVAAASQYGTPVYLYDEQFIVNRCQALKAMPNAYGLTVRYAMKAHSTGAILRLIHREGLSFDASSLNEVRRAGMNGIPFSSITLTAQEVPLGEDRRDLERMMLGGLKYNACSIRQLDLVLDFAAEHGLTLALRIHPGVGSGETATRNTGDDYSCFGIHLNDIERAIAMAARKGVVIDHVHVHIGSGADMNIWRQNIDLELGFVERYFPDAVTVSFGGGLKEARMPDEKSANLAALGEYAKLRIEEFFGRTCRRLKMEIEPGTYVMANAGYAITRVMDKKRTGENGFNFLITDGGMEINARPLMYGSRHPFYVVSGDGRLLSSEFEGLDPEFEAVVVGKCCESGDAQTLDMEGHSVTRGMAEPEVGDYVVIGGTGAYCSSMTPMNYNSHTQIAEVMRESGGALRLIRRRQTLEQVLENELN